jgi:hypothetical protein
VIYISDTKCAPVDIKLQIGTNYIGIFSILIDEVNNLHATLVSVFVCVSFDRFIKGPSQNSLMPKKHLVWREGVVEIDLQT